MPSSFLASRCRTGFFFLLTASQTLLLIVLPGGAGSAKELLSDEDININVYEQAHESVVNITTVVVDYDLFLRPFASESSGSGIVLDKKGHILTNRHVIAEAARLEVTLGDGSKWPSKLVGEDPATDLAVIRIQSPPRSLRPIHFGDSGGIKVGQKVLAIGNPFGLEQTLTTGIISSIRRFLKINDIEMDNVIQTDAAINPGNSGGPLLDSSGRMIGINTAIFSPSGGNVGIGFAVPVDTAKWVVRELISKGYVAYAWMGMELQTLIPKYAEVLEIPVEKGVLIGRLVRGGPGDLSGIQGGSASVIVGNTRLIIGGDVIVAADGKRVETSEDLTRYLRTKKPGEVISFTLFRGNKKQEIPVKLSERPRR